MRPRDRRADSGFSLIELLVAMAIMLIISGAAVTALLKMMNAQATIWNRTQMHSGIRGATEVLQQEVGQAGRVTLPVAVSTGASPIIGTPIPAPPTTPIPQTVSVTSAAGFYVGENVVVDVGASEETVTLTAVDTSANTISGVFTLNHNASVPVNVYGSFSAGVVPPNMTNGSSGTVLKLFGDINGDGNMVYIEYSCVIPNGGIGNLYRNSMPWNQTGGSPAATQSQILLSNITANPNGTACFTYQTATINSITFVTDVAITLTVQTQIVDPVTKEFQNETKALLNVSPRNVFSAWQNQSLGIPERVQPIPPSITALLQ